MSGIRHKNIRSDIGTELVTDGYIIPTKKPEKTWHLLWDGDQSYSRMSRRPRDCDAHLLTDYLDKTNEEGNVWSVWNAKFPGNAKVFWPVVARLAQDQMYLKVPDVMDFALTWTEDNPKSFKKKLDRLTSEIYAELGQLDLEMDETVRGKKRLQASLSIQQNEKAQSLLDSLE